MCWHNLWLTRSEELSNYLSIGLTPPNKYPILSYTSHAKRSNSKSFLSALEHRLLFISIFSWRYRYLLSKNQKKFGCWPAFILRLDSETRHLSQPSSASWSLFSNSRCNENWKTSWNLSIKLKIHVRRLQIVIRVHKSRITQIPPTSLTFYTCSGALI